MSTLRLLGRIAVLSLLLIVTGGARAGVPVMLTYSIDKDVVVPLLDLPDTEPFMYRGEKFSGYVDVGYRYKQFDVCHIPLWNYEGQYCGYIPGAQGWLAIPEAKLKEITWGAGLRFPHTPRLPFWDAFGGKLAMLLLIVGCRVLGRRISM